MSKLDRRFNRGDCLNTETVMTPQTTTTQMGITWYITFV